MGKFEFKILMGLHLLGLHLLRAFALLSRRSGVAGNKELQICQSFSSFLAQ